MLMNYSRLLMNLLRHLSALYVKNLMHFENELFLPSASRRKDEIPSQSSAYWKIIKPSNGVNH